jgi:glutamine amidotransferase
MILVIDYGMGNLRSVQKAFEFLGHEATVSEDVSLVDKASHVVLPGDAAFGDAMRNLRTGGWDQAILKGIESGKPFLGICVGLQLMFSESDERGTHRGLDLLPGKVKLFPSSERVPQIGWNQIEINRKCEILEGVPEGSFFYFVHSYYVETAVPEDSVAVTDYGMKYTSIAQRDHIYGVQFHPEKSQDFGLKILDNFANLN